jgi:hypothetical protein
MHWRRRGYGEQTPVHRNSAPFIQMKISPPPSNSGLNLASRAVLRRRPRLPFDFFTASDRSQLVLTPTRDFAQDKLLSQTEHNVEAHVSAEISENKSRTTVRTWVVDVGQRS